jgi:hypothetical protein
VSATAYLKRLELISRSIRHGSAKTVVVSVPTQLIPIENNVEMDVLVTPESRAAADEILQALDVSEHDLVIEVGRFTDELPELISVT